MLLERRMIRTLSQHKSSKPPDYTQSILKDESINMKKVDN